VLDLAKSEALQVRGEELTVDKDTDGGYDVIISRALASLDEFTQIALPLLAEKGIIIALKGRADPVEIEGLSKFFAELQDKPKNQRIYSLKWHTYLLPFLQSERSVIIIKSESTKSPYTNNDSTLAVRP
jgi:16S rRNA G527 N7-methylase RsmG